MFIIYLIASIIIFAASRTFFKPIIFERLPDASYTEKETIFILQTVTIIIPLTLMFIVHPIVKAVMGPIQKISNVVTNIDDRREAFKKLFGPIRIG